MDRSHPRAPSPDRISAADAQPRKATSDAAEEPGWECYDFNGDHIDVMNPRSSASQA
jgi:hypothetical protein